MLKKSGLSAIFVAALLSTAHAEQSANEKTAVQAQSATADDTKNPFKPSISESRKAEKSADRLVDRVNSLRQMYKDDAAQGDLTFQNTYNIDRPLTLPEVMDFEHPILKLRLSSLTEKERDEILKSIQEEADKFNRYKAIMNHGIKYGSSAALYKTSRDYFDLYSKTYYHDMVKLFPFHALMLEGGKIKPPLIEELGYQIQKDDKRTLRKIKRKFRIAEQAEVTLSAPNYMDFYENLLLVPEPKIPPVYFMPINEEELEYWKKGVVNGWHEGGKQAQEIVRQNTRNALRTMFGYIRFHVLADKGVVNMPTAQNITVGTNSRGDVMNIGESIFEITELPQLNDNEQSWIALPEVDDIFSKLTQEDIDELAGEIEEIGKI